PDAQSVTRLESAQVDALLAMRNFPAIRPLLSHICCVREKDAGTTPGDYVRALAKLGQFDLDQSQFKQAEPELKKALDLAREKKVDKELQVLCMRSWADLLNQTNRKAESQKILSQAATLEQSASDTGSASN